MCLCLVRGTMLRSTRRLSKSDCQRPLYSMALYSVSIKQCVFRQRKKEKTKSKQTPHNKQQQNQAQFQLFALSGSITEVESRQPPTRGVGHSAPPMAPTELIVNFFPAFPLILPLLVEYASYLSCNLWCLDPLEFNKNFMNA